MKSCSREHLDQIRAAMKQLTDKVSPPPSSPAPVLAPRVIETSVSKSVVAIFFAHLAPIRLGHDVGESYKCFRMERKRCRGSKPPYKNVRRGFARV